MDDYLPLLLASPWQSHFFGPRFSSLQRDSFSLYTTSLQKMLETTSLCPKRRAFLVQLSDDNFWEGLKRSKSATADYEKIAALQKKWKKIAPVAHLSARQLLNLFRESILPLEMNYQQILAQLEGGSIPEEGGRGRQRKRNLQAKIEEKVKSYQGRLKKLKEATLAAMRFCSEAHHILKAPRNVDDILARFSQELSALAGRKNKIKNIRAQLATLDDDKRLCFFDILKKNSHVVESKLYQEFIASIPQRHLQRRKKGSVIQAELEEVSVFCEKVIEDLRLDHVRDYLPFLMPLQPRFSFFPAWVRNAWTNGSLRFLRRSGLEEIAYGIWALRYVFYFLLSFSAYYLLWQFLNAVAVVLFKSTLSLFFKNFLFYTLAVAPLWKWGIDALSHGYHFIFNYLTHRKKQEIVSALLILERSQHFICHQLSHTIINITLFDIEDLLERVKFYQDQLQAAATALSYFYRGEKLLCYGAVYESSMTVKTRMLLQYQEINKHLRALAGHIVKRTNEEMALLTQDIQENNVIPLLPRAQLAQLQRFVEAWGSAELKRDLIEKTTLLKKWQAYLQTTAFLRENPSPLYYEEPWGNKILEAAGLQGWEIILRAFLTNERQLAACEFIHALFKGEKKEINEFELKGVLAVLSLSPDIIEKPMWEMLAFRPYFANKLSYSYQQRITDWAHKKAALLAEAKTQLENLFNVPSQEMPMRFERKPKEEWVKFLALLRAQYIVDGLANPACMQFASFLSKIRDFFYQYEGQTALAYLLLDLLPYKEQKNLFLLLIKKRLTYLIHHFNKRQSNLVQIADIDCVAHFKKIFPECEKEIIHFIDDFLQKEGWPEEKKKAFFRICQEMRLQKEASFTPAYVQLVLTENSALIRHPNQQPVSFSLSSRRKRI